MAVNKVDRAKQDALVTFGLGAAAAVVGFCTVFVGVGGALLMGSRSPLGVIALGVSLVLIAFAALVAAYATVASAC